MNMNKWEKLITIVITAIAATCLSSCERLSVKKSMKRMMAEAIIMPDSLLEVSEDSITCCNLNADNSLIVYIDSQQCKSCVFSNLKGYELLYKQSQSSSMFKLVIIISPARNEKENVIALARSLIGFPVYIDVNNDFMEINKNIPKQKLSTHS